MFFEVKILHFLPASSVRQHHCLPWKKRSKLMFFTLTFSDKQIKTASKSHFDKIGDRKSNTLVAEPVEATESNRHTLNWSLSLSGRAIRNNKNYSNILI